MRYSQVNLKLFQLHIGKPCVFDNDGLGAYKTWCAISLNSREATMDAFS